MHFFLSDPVPFKIHGSDLLPVLVFQLCVHKKCFFGLRKTGNISFHAQGVLVLLSSCGKQSSGSGSRSFRWIRVDPGGSGWIRVDPDPNMEKSSVPVLVRTPVKQGCGSGLACFGRIRIRAVFRKPGIGFSLITLIQNHSKPYYLINNYHTPL